MIQFGMRCHDLCPKMEMEKLFEEVKANNIHQVQLAFKKSITNYDFSTGHYSAGFGRYIRSLLEKNDIHVAVLGCYINPTNPIESRRQAEVARFIEHLKYAKAMGAYRRRKYDKCGERRRKACRKCVNTGAGCEKCDKVWKRGTGGDGGAAG